MPLSPQPPSSAPTFLSPKTPSHRIRTNLRSPSPNYFAFSVDPSTTTVHSAGSVRNKQWTSIESDIRSAAAASPQSLNAVSETADFDAFRKRSEQQAFFNLRTNSLSNPSRSQDPKRPESSQPNGDCVDNSVKPSPLPVGAAMKLAFGATEQPATEEGSLISRSPKRSADSNNFPDRPRRDSPGRLVNDGETCQSNGSPPLRNDDKLPRLSLPHHSVELASQGFRTSKADTFASANDATFQTVMESSQHIVNVLESHTDDVLLLDLRVSTQYARARITGALNLCVPTTLLKRTSYTVEKLADTFKDDPEQKAKFDCWRSCRYIIVYDTCATQLKEATNCVNVLKKFSSEGWTGNSCIIRGGFTDFERKFPAYVDRRALSLSNSSGPHLQRRVSDSPGAPPVVGGCPMPPNQNAANPFFGNIRQNMDLIGGVGQLPVHRPTFLKDHHITCLPDWLARASEEKDNGQIVSCKFLQIERREQKRMQDALSEDVKYSFSMDDDTQKVRIAGLEKGAKNRYNNIWPYEHTRVRLKGVGRDGCDYINASSIRTSHSRKQYIATQGPIPATFGDFWNMVWQRDVRVVVMLTAETEGGQIKAHNYWNERSYGPIQVRFLSEHRATLEPAKIHKARPKSSNRHHHRSFTNPIGVASFPSSNSNGTSDDSHTSSTLIDNGSDRPFVTVRRFTISHEAHPFEQMRELTQLHYSHWPDFGAPAHPTHLLGLIEQCNAVSRSYADDDGGHRYERPVVVHCSAGCGRTGTFCTVDTVVDLLRQQRRERKTPQTQGDMNTQSSDQWLWRDDTDLVEATVEEFRMQRLSMVQSLRQFVLCYETVLEWVAEEEHPKTA